MRTFTVLSFCFLILSPLVLAIPAKTIGGKHIKPIAPKIDMCPECVDLMNQFIDQLLNAILNAGVIGSCGALCSAIPNQAASVVCDLLCDYVGIEAFIDAINMTDPIQSTFANLLMFALLLPMVMSPLFQQLLNHDLDQLELPSKLVSLTRLFLLLDLEDLLLKLMPLTELP